MSPGSQRRSKRKQPNAMVLLLAAALMFGIIWYFTEFLAWLK